LKPKHFLIVILICFGFFALTFLNPYPFGYDSFYYLNVVCNSAPFVVGELPLSVALFSVLPCNIILIKCLLFLCCLSACLSCSLLGEHFVKDKGWFGLVFLCFVRLFGCRVFGLLRMRRLLLRCCFLLLGCFILEVMQKRLWQYF